MPPKEHLKPLSWSQNVCSMILAGGTAGFIGVSVCFPLIFAKNSLQYSPEKFSSTSIFKTLLQIRREKGTFRAWYKGIAPNLMGIPFEKAIKLVVNDLTVSHLRSKGAVEANGSTKVWAMVAGGAAAGTCQVVATCPMELYVTQSVVKHRSVAETWRVYGVRLAYTGFIASLFRDVWFSIWFFPMDRILKNASKKYLCDTEAEIFVKKLACGTIAGGFSAFISTPLDVCKTIVQGRTPKGPNGIPVLLPLHKQVTEVAHVWKEVASTRGYGFRGLLSGSIPRCVQCALFVVVTFSQVVAGIVAVHLTESWL